MARKRIFVVLPGDRRKLGSLPLDSFLSGHLNRMGPVLSAFTGQADDERPS